MFVVVSLECESNKVAEDDGSLEVCAVLTAGLPAGNLTSAISIVLNTTCVDACS